MQSLECHICLQSNSASELVPQVETDYGKELKIAAWCPDLPLPFNVIVWPARFYCFIVLLGRLRLPCEKSFGALSNPFFTKKKNYFRWQSSMVVSPVYQLGQEKHSIHELSSC